jgi:hypothetical protein
LHEFDQAIASATELGGQLAATLRDGLAAGTVRPVRVENG